MIIRDILAILLCLTVGIGSAYLAKKLLHMTYTPKTRIGFILFESFLGERAYQKRFTIWCLNFFASQMALYVMLFSFTFIFGSYLNSHPSFPIILGVLIGFWILAFWLIRRYYIYR